MTVDAAVYRRAIANFATGVAVITTTVDGKPVGMTASAVSSLSLDPVLLLVCISSRLPTHTAIAGRGRFGVNVLGEESEALARHFATPQPDKFALMTIQDHQLDPPILPQAIAHFVCDVERSVSCGDHTIFIGAVERCECTGTGQPLLYFRSAFGRLETPDDYMLHRGVWDAGL
jgi:3-hydroxy-9,10-secoandrosta-1,3,5(10)-triene-9,17-dione monooxygenase reductase component